MRWELVPYALKVAHIVPPRWEVSLGRGQYRMTYVPWVLKDLNYREILRATSKFVILDHGLFEANLEVPSPWKIALVARMMNADEVVLPDVLGDPVETVSKALKALQYLPSEAGLMFVPQGHAYDEWQDCLLRFLEYIAPKHFCGTIGLSSLRRPGSLRAQVGTRILMMKYLRPLGFEMHLLGLCSVRHFVEEELPIALELGVRGVDTCAAFALGARGLGLTKDSPRLFLGDLKKYKYLTEDTLLLIKRNMDTLENWIKGD